MTRYPRLTWAGLTSLACVHGALAQGGDGSRAPAWANDFTARVEALALLQTLNAELLSHDSATLTLDRWCGAHHLASPAKIVAARDKDANKEPTADQRRLLNAGRSTIVAGPVVRWRTPTRTRSTLSIRLHVRAQIAIQRKQARDK